MSTIIPAEIERFVIPREVLADTRELLREPGEEGLEAIVLWLGTATPAEARVLLAHRPHQIAFRSEHGVGVEVPQGALSELISALPERVFVLARLHSHPTRPYHSPVDDDNLLIAHQGAISIVVPDFARDPIELERCSVNRLDVEVGWQELSAEEVQERFLVDG